MARMMKDEPDNYDWYQGLKKSPLNPPKWVFPVAWSILYTCIGVSIVIYLQTTGLVYTHGLLFWIIQMISNLVWSPLFFSKKMIRAAFVDILVMWVSIFFTILQFQTINMIAAYLLYPYLVWVSFATYLNGYIMINNPQGVRKNHSDNSKFY